MHLHKKLDSSFSRKFFVQTARQTDTAVANAMLNYVTVKWPKALVLDRPKLISALVLNWILATSNQITLQF